MAEHIIGDYMSLITAVDDELSRLGIEQRELAEMDHVCYRVETLERYHEMLARAATIATLLDESNINGRPIATFEFHDYLQTKNWRVPYLEVPAPKDSSAYKEGLEHVELVVIGSLERFMVRHSDLSFSRSAGNPINPEARIKTDAVTIKFHEQQLGAVVAIEGRLRATGTEL